MSPMDVLHGITQLLWTTSWQAGVMAGAIWLTCRRWPRMPANLQVMLWWLVSLKFVIGLAWTQPIALPVLPASFGSVSIGSSSLQSDAIGSDAIGSDTIRRDAIGGDTTIGGETIRNDAIEGDATIGTDVIRRAGGAIERRDQRGLDIAPPARRGSGEGAIEERSGGVYVAPPARRQRDGLTALAIVAGCWMLGVLMQAALLVRQLARTRRLVARSQPVDGDAAELFDDLVDRLDIRGNRPRLRVSTEIATPQVTGLVHPIVLLPVGTLESFTTRELTLTLCHELMHVQRFDLWHGWIPSVAARLFFFHPLAHLTAREYAIAREAACDARVLAFTQAPAYDYGRLLMRLGVTAREAAPAAAGASPTLRTLKRRLLMLHDASPHARRLSPRWWVLAAVAALLVIPMRPTAQQHQHVEKHQHAAKLQHEPKHQHEGESWVFLQGDDVASMHGSSQDLSEAKRQRVNSSESLLWFKQDGRAYVVRDRQTLDKAHALFIPQRSLSKAQRDLGDRQTILGARQTTLGKTQEALSDQVRESADKVKDANDALAKGVDRQIPRGEVEKQIAHIEATLQQAEAIRRQIEKEQEALAIQQRSLGDHQAALGAEQEALGRQQEEVARTITWEIRTLLNSALAAGLATPVK